ncbi:hypothetical protein ABIE59_003455 [Marinobacter sp. MBR-99]|jgi:hypothetical protein|uniref:hypothetical protein n=1 Tax=Marinobacter sp. MBR-99 TaxID=3156461 RepID=UPI00339A7341
MFDLMGAIRQRQKGQTPPLADSAETAESPQPRGGELAEGLRKTADNCGPGIFSATLRKNPQTPKTSEPPKTKGCREFSANPQNPQPLAGKERQNPDAVLLEIARTLKADFHMLRALLSDDDMQAIAENCPGYERARLADYFRLMESHGKPLYDIDHHLNQMERQSATRNRQKARQGIEHEQAWRAAHDGLIDHVMKPCPDCYAPRARYCPTGATLRRAYLEALNSTTQPEH